MNADDGNHVNAGGGEPVHAGENRRFRQPVALPGGGHDAYLSIGSNIGDRLAYLQEGLNQLAAEPGIEIVDISSVYETDPWGLTSQRAFYNAVVWIRTTLLPLRLLRICQRIEHRAGRRRDIRWGPRTLDIDILMFDHLNIDTPRLILPHPRINERDFVLVPLAEVRSGAQLERPGVHRLTDERLEWPEKG